MTASLALAGVILATDIAQASAPQSDPASWLTLMVQAPAIGVLIWFMLRAEKRMDEQTKAVIIQAGATDRNSQALMIAVVALKHGDGNISELAERLKAKSEAAQSSYEHPSR